MISQANLVWLLDPVLARQLCPGIPPLLTFCSQTGRHCLRGSPPSSTSSHSTHLSVPPQWQGHANSAVKVRCGSTDGKHHIHSGRSTYRHNRSRCSDQAVRLQPHFIPLLPLLCVVCVCGMCVCVAEGNCMSCVTIYPIWAHVPIYTLAVVMNNFIASIKSCMHLHD